MNLGDELKRLEEELANARKMQADAMVSVCRLEGAYFAVKKMIEQGVDGNTDDNA